MLLHTAKNERLRPQTVRCRRRLPRPPIAGANSLDAGASAKAMLRPPRRSGHDSLAHRDHQMLMYIGAPRAFVPSCGKVEQWGQRELLCCLSRMADGYCCLACSDGMAIRRFGGPRAKVRR
jgi:hypothetical protein